MSQDKTMHGSSRPGTMRTALVMASIALVLFIGFIARIWIFGK